MLRTYKSVKTLILVTSLLAFNVGTSYASSWQQQWSSQYVSWKTDGHVTEAWNIDQNVRIVKPNNSSYWPMQWGFNGVNSGGYMGLQQGDSAGHQDVRFSIWDAKAAQGQNCKPFGGEGIGQTCTLDVTINPNKFYRYRLWALDRDSDGQWWGGWLLEDDGHGGVIEHLIGKIKAPATAKLINPNSISNFGEYWGKAVPNCKDVPMSIALFMPPSFNSKDKGTYEGYAQFKNSAKAGGNHCVTGMEDNGAFITVQPYNDQSAKGAIMFLGGTTKEHIFNVN